MIRAGIIGGTGLYDPRHFGEAEETEVQTPYGPVTLYVVETKEMEVVFLPRHGVEHSLLPHQINYRGNIWALKELEVDSVLATAAVGSLNKDLKPGDLLLLEQFIDFTKGRPSTFFEKLGDAYHVDVTQPYCPFLRQKLVETTSQLGIKLHTSAVYVCTEGPRFETAAEIVAFQKLGADVVGMTNVPEVVLAREAEMCYAALAMVSNMAAGIAQGELTAMEVREKVAQMNLYVKKIFKETLPKLGEERGCNCRQSLKKAKM